MGSRKERSGKSQRGRYILIPNIALKLFPFLSTSQENDHAIISITPLFHGIEKFNLPRCYCDFVYHNSKLFFDQKNGRNEHRIYISKDLDEGGFFDDDIIIIRRHFPISQIDLDTDTFPLTSPTKAGFEYLIDWVRQDRDREQWNSYNKIILDNSGSRKNTSSALFNGYLQDFENKALYNSPNGLRVDERIIKDFRKINTPTTDSHRIETSEDFELGKLSTYANLFDASSFRDFVLTTYGNTCAITNEVISYGTFNNLEAAHIHPRCHGGYYLPQNGIAMRRDIHWAYDKGMFYIEPITLRVRVHPEIINSYLNRYDGITITPLTPEFAPKDAFLLYHKNNIYGSFLHTGSLKPLASSQTKK